MEKIKIHCLYEHGDDNISYGSSYIRLLCPLSHPSVTDKIRLSSGISLPNDIVDAVIIDRLWKPKLKLFEIEGLIHQIRKNGSAFIYALDDNLLDLFYNEPCHVSFSDEQRMCIRYFVREADGVIVSTDFLKKRLSRLNEHIYIMPNALDDRLFIQIPLKQPMKIDSQRLIKIGYMGTLTHIDDLMMILYPLRRIMRACKTRVSFELVGITNDATNVVNLFKGLDVKFLDVGNNSFYPKFPGWMERNMDWDIGIAPLNNTYFNRCKSDIKFLDYSALGIPGIYSNLEPYNSVSNMVTGWLCDNTDEDWYNKLTQAINESEMRHQIATRSQEYVYGHRMLNKKAIDLVNIIISITSNTRQKRNQEHQIEPI